jgi:hypothetical protein
MTQVVELLPSRSSKKKKKSWEKRGSEKLLFLRSRGNLKTNLNTGPWLRSTLSKVPCLAEAATLSPQLQRL